MDNNSRVQLNIGDIIIATITKVFNTHVELSLGDICAVMPTSEYSWKRRSNIKNELKVGARIKAVVIAMKNGIAMLSVKRMKTDPWRSVDEIFKTGMLVKGEIKKILDYGAFIELNNGVQGLLHRTNIVQDPKIDIRTIVSEGQEIEVNIISIEKEERKISFSMIKVQ